MGLHHLHKRTKRAKNKNENKWILFLDKILIAIAIIGPLNALPQILKIYVDKNTSGVSIISWAMFSLFDIPWIIYGIVHKEKPIIIAYTLWFLTNMTVVIGCILY